MKLLGGGSFLNGATPSSSFRQALQKQVNLVPPSQQRFHKQRFLQNLNCQKSCWDQARLFSLVNKSVCWQGTQSMLTPTLILIHTLLGTQVTPCQPFHSGCTYKLRKRRMDLIYHSPKTVFVEQPLEKTGRSKVFTNVQTLGRNSSIY